MIIVIIFAIVLFVLMFLESYFKTDPEMVKTISRALDVVIGIGAVLLVWFLHHVSTNKTGV